MIKQYDIDDFLKSQFINIHFREINEKQKLNDKDIPPDWVIDCFRNVVIECGNFDDYKNNIFYEDDDEEFIERIKNEGACYINEDERIVGFIKVDPY